MSIKVVNGTNKRKAKQRLENYVERIGAATIAWNNQATRIEMIQSLIPLGLMAVEDILQAEVRNLVGERYSRDTDAKRWGSNPGSVFLGEQKVSIRVPRVRKLREQEEVTLESYRQLQRPQAIDDAVYRRVIRGISTAKYEQVANTIPETFGIKRSSVSRRFVLACQKKLKEFSERDLSVYDFVAVFIDGKAFGDNEIVIAMGVTMTGEKIILGFVETANETGRMCSQFVEGLVERGFKVSHEILFVIDGAKGLRKGLKDALGDNAVIQRCQWHKRENVASYFDGSKQKQIRQKLQAAYQQPTEAKARKALEQIGRELKLVNESAYNSLQEGLEDTLTAYKLGIPNVLAQSLRTTNCIENLNALVGAYTDRVDHWRTSNQRQRWVASALLEIEPKLRRVKGHQHIPLLLNALKEFRSKDESKALKVA